MLQYQQHLFRAFCVIANSWWSESTSIFCVNDVMCRMLWRHLSSLPHQRGFTALSVLHKFEGLIERTRHNYWYLRNPLPLQALQINNERDSARKRMGSSETSGRSETFFFPIFVAKLTCIVKKKAPRLPRSQAQTKKGRGILGSSSKRRFVSFKQKTTYVAGWSKHAKYNSFPMIFLQL